MIFREKCHYSRFVWSSASSTWKLVKNQSETAQRDGLSKWARIEVDEDSCNSSSPQVQHRKSWSQSKSWMIIVIDEWEKGLSESQQKCIMRSMRYREEIYKSAVCKSRSGRYRKRLRPSIQEVDDVIIRVVRVAFMSRFELPIQILQEVTKIWTRSDWTLKKWRSITTVKPGWFVIAFFTRVRPVECLSFGLLVLWTTHW